MRRAVLAALLAVAGLALNSTAGAAGPRDRLHATIVFTAEQKADLKRIADYLNGIVTMQGRFLQIQPDGQSAQGTFYMMKPGRVRFEYAPPTPTLIVADGNTIAVENTELKTIDRYLLGGTPLKFLLSSNINLVGDPRIAAVAREPGLLRVTARETSGPAEGEITLTFSDPDLELRQWEILDSQGLKTTVVLTDVHDGVELAPDLFTIGAAASGRTSNP